MKKILISGAGIAGTVSGWWLARAGYKVTIVEKYAVLRTGGYSVDIRGAAVEVIRRMGLEEVIQQKSSGIATAIFVDEKDQPLVSLPSDVMEMQSEGDLELIRGELLSILYDATKESCNYLFDTVITGLIENECGVDVSFNNRESERFDIVIGADGMHSNVRKLLFGGESKFSYSYGDYYFAFFSTNNFNLGKTEKFFCAPNKTINIYTPKTGSQSKALFIIKEDGFAPDENPSKAIIKLFSGLKWKVSDLLHDLNQSNDLYVDQIKQIRMERWHSANTVLVGDAAYAPSLATGQGTSMAIVGAYVLAREIIASNGDAQVAFSRYHEALKKYVQLNQKMGKNVKNMVAKNAGVLKMQIRFLKLMARTPFLIRLMKKGMAKAANAVDIH